MKFTAEQLSLFEIEAEDSLAVYGTDSIPFLVVTSTTPTLTSALTMTASVTAKTITKSSPPSE
jgi:hypothetical protein